jgi:hypothetical protein
MRAHTRAHEWLTIRLRRLYKQNNRCGACSHSPAARRFARSLDVHHIRPVSQRPELELEDANTIGLCIACHDSIHHVLNHRVLSNLVRLATDPTPTLRVECEPIPHQVALPFPAANVPAANDEEFNDALPAMPTQS